MKGTQNEDSKSFPSHRELGGEVLSTKQLPQTLIQSTFGKGIQIDCISFIETTLINNNILAEKINALSDKNIYAVFTSAIAAKAVGGMTKQQSQWNIFSLHSKTKKCVEKNFSASTILDVAQNGKQLANKIISHTDVKEVIFFCGDKRMDDLPNILAYNNINVQEIVVYETGLTPQKIEKKYNAILFYSPSGVESFFSLNTITKDVQLIAIGNATANAIRKLSQNKIHIAENADAASMIELVQRLYNSNI